MAESVYKVIELVGTSTESWENAAAAAVATASKTLRGEAGSCEHLSYGKGVAPQQVAF